MKQSRVRQTVTRSLAVATAAVTIAVVPLVATPASADTVRGLSWHLDSLRIPRAQQLSKGAGVTVVVLDGGVQANNQDLAGQVVGGRGFAADTAGDGRTDPDTRVSHGTGMASLIAGRGGGDQRMLGIAPQAKIMPAAIGMGATAAPEAIRWAADQRPGVISISMEPDSAAASPDLAAAISYAQSRDVVVVASAGNTGNDTLSSLARLPGVVSVGAIDRDEKLWSNSGRGPELALTAPGVQVIMSVNRSTSPNGYGVGSGTSQAAAIVSGVVALIRSRFPDLDAANVVNRLVTTASDKGDKGRDSSYGFGVVDPVRALTADVPTVTANPLGAAAATPDTDGGIERPPGDDSSDLGVSVHVDWAGLLPYGLGCLVVVAAIVVLVVWLSRRRRPRAPAYPPQHVPGPTPPYGVPSPYYPPPGQGPPPGVRPGDQRQPPPPAGGR